MRLPSVGEQVSVVARTRLATLIADAARTHFWVARLRDAGLDGTRLRAADAFAALHALPPVSARELRLAGWGALRDGWARPWWPSSRSSGPAGETFRVYYDVAAWALLNYAVKLRARMACGVTGDARIAALEPIPVSREGYSLPELVRPFQRISTLQPAAAIAEKLVLHHPSALYGSASALLEAGRALDGLGCRLPVRAVFTTGEVLPAATRAALAGLFHAPVLDVYGTPETKEIAWECPFGGRHVNADVLHVEVLGPDGAVLPTGEEGEIVVSLLVNRAMPLLRYRTGDRGYLLPDRCACGCALPLLAVVSGRRALDLDQGRRVRAIPIDFADRRRADFGIRAVRRRVVERAFGAGGELARERLRPFDPLAGSVGIHSDRNLS